MRYILNPEIALRSWWLVPCGYYQKGEEYAKGLTREEFSLLSQCDGIQEIEPEDLLEELCRRRLCLPCKEGQTLTEWQRPRYCDNRYFPSMNWMITSKCNYNCLHCFNAADNAALMDEWSLEEAEILLDEARDCGINAFTITGGEPMLHKDFFTIMEGIYRRGMYVEELNTNGFFLDQKALDRLKELEIRPLIKLSFDGLSHHDWLRNRTGAEEDALRAIRLCRENGFRVMVQTNVHKGNLESMLSTAELMEEMGVETMRIIRTTEAPRWLQNGGAYTLTMEEYFETTLELLAGYKKRLKRMQVVMWQFATLYPAERSYSVAAIAGSEEDYRDSIPVCKGNRGMVAVAANGNLFPCHQMSGYYEQHGDILGNVKQTGLKSCLQQGDYLKEVCTTLGELKEKNPRCAACKYFKICRGGCRAIGLAFTADKMGIDPSKCLFFEKEYAKKLEKILEGYHCLTPMSCQEASVKEDLCTCAAD